MYPDSLDDNGAADEEGDGDENVNEMEVTASGNTLQSDGSRETKEKPHLSQGKRKLDQSVGGAFGSEELGDYGGILKEMAVGDKGRAGVIRVYELLAEDARR
ncbi:unnamed protein product [Penicillium viridicatum]